jgi:hypothetical protein
MKHPLYKLSVCISTLALAVAATGCNKMPPECADAQSIDLLKKVLVDNMLAGDNFKTVRLKADQFEASDSHTTAVDDKLQTRSCAADVTYRVSDAALTLLNAPLDDPRLSLVFRLLIKNNGGEAALMFLGQPEEATPLPPFFLQQANVIRTTAKASIKGGKLKLGEISYKLRMSEEHSSSVQFLLETKIPHQPQAALALIESFAEYATDSEHKRSPYANKQMEDGTEKQEKIAAQTRALLFTPLGEAVDFLEKRNLTEEKDYIGRAVFKSGKILVLIEYAPTGTAPIGVLSSSAPIPSDMSAAQNIEAFERAADKEGFVELKEGVKLYCDRETGPRGQDETVCVVLEHETAAPKTVTSVWFPYGPIWE